MAESLSIDSIIDILVEPTKSICKITRSILDSTDFSRMRWLLLSEILNSGFTFSAFHILICESLIMDSISIAGSRYDLLMRRYSGLDLGVNEVPLLLSSHLPCSSLMISRTLSLGASNSSAIISGLIPELYKLRIVVL